MTAQAIAEKRYYVIGCVLWEAEFVTVNMSFFRKPGTEKVVRECENQEIAKQAHLEILEEVGLMPAYRPEIAIGTF
jgi:hypothetical protein